MSGATDAIVYTSTTTAGAGSAVFAAAAAAGGVLVAGAAVYLAARKMRADYCAALTEYQTRSDREAALFAAQQATRQAAQDRARALSLSLSEKALEDPNTAFLLSGIGRLKNRLGGLGDPNDPTPGNGVAILFRQCEDILERINAGEVTAQLAAYERLSEAVTALATQVRLAQGKVPAKSVALAHEAIAALREDLNDSLLAERRHEKTRFALLERLVEIERLAENQPGVVLQGLALLRERFRGELHAAAAEAALQAKNALRVRELVGEISAHAQAVLQQEVLQAPRREAELLLKRVSAVVAATPVELTALEALSFEAKDLFEATETAIDEKAMAEYLEDQVSQVLGSLGYRVTMASSGTEEKKLVAVLDSGIGVQLNVDGRGGLSGEMVAFSEHTAEVDFYQQERVCDLMDAIFDGLRRKNMVVREKKRKNFKVGSDRVKVVRPVERVENTAIATEKKALEMKLDA
jgi:hypothetical protein